MTPQLEQLTRSKIEQEGLRSRQLREIGDRRTGLYRAAQFFEICCQCARQTRRSAFWEGPAFTMTRQQKKKRYGRRRQVGQGLHGMRRHTGKQPTGFHRPKPARQMFCGA